MEVTFLFLDRKVKHFCSICTEKCREVMAGEGHL